MTAQAFKQTGTLRLSMSKVVKMNPKDILFSLPTICNEIPAASPSKQSSPQHFELHEDDWRQIEFISDSQKELILAELQAIQGIYQKHRVGRGFNQLHVRDRIKDAILSPLSFDEILNSFTKKESLETIIYTQSKDEINNAFAFKIEPCVIYGHRKNDTVTTLGIHYINNPKGISAELIENMVQLMQAKYLVLVDWVNLSVVDASKESLEKYFYQ